MSRVPLWLWGQMPPTCASVSSGCPVPPGGPGRARCSSPPSGSPRAGFGERESGGAAWTAADTVRSLDSGRPAQPTPGPACEACGVPGHFLPVVPRRVFVGDAIAPGKVPVGAAGPHGPGAECQLAGLQPCGEKGCPSVLRPRLRADAPMLPRACSLLILHFPMVTAPWAGLRRELRERVPISRAAECPRQKDRGSGGVEWHQTLLLSPRWPCAWRWGSGCSGNSGWLRGKK